MAQALQPQGSSSNAQLVDVAGSSPGTSVLGNSLISQPGDVAGSTKDQVEGPRVITAVAQAQPQWGPPYPQPRPSRDTPPSQGADKLDDSSHRWVKNLSKTP